MDGGAAWTVARGAMRRGVARHGGNRTGGVAHELLGELQDVGEVLGDIGSGAVVDEGVGEGLDVGGLLVKQLGGGGLVEERLERLSRG
eukprot:710948-Prymnesium_polylepis.1